MNRIVKIILQDILKNKIVVIYTIVLALLAWSAFSLEDNITKGLLTILNIILFPFCPDCIQCYYGAGK